MSDASGLGGLRAAERYIEVGRPERALEVLAELDGETAGSTEGRLVRASAHYGLEDFRAAADTARDALEDEPDSPSLLYLLSLASEQLGDLEEAEAAVLAALELDPEDVQLLCQYAGVLMRGGQLDKAEQLLDVAASLDPDSPDVLRERLSLAYVRHDDRRVRELTEELLALDPESAQGHRMLGVLAFNRGDAVEAARRMAETVRADPANERYAADARTAKALQNPLWWPTRVVQRFGAIQMWIAYLVIAFTLRSGGFTSLAGILGIAWIVFCVWSWVAPPILRRVQGLEA